MIPGGTRTSVYKHFSDCMSNRFSFIQLSPKRFRPPVRPRYDDNYRILIALIASWRVRELACAEFKSSTDTVPTDTAYSNKIVTAYNGDQTARRPLNLSSSISDCMPASDVIFGKVEAQLGLYIHTKFGDYSSNGSQIIRSSDNSSARPTQIR